MKSAPSIARKAARSLSKAACGLAGTNRRTVMANAGRTKIVESRVQFLGSPPKEQVDGSTFEDLSVPPQKVRRSEGSWWKLASHRELPGLPNVHAFD